MTEAIRLTAIKDLQDLAETNNAETTSRPSHNNPCFACGACCAHFRISFYSGELEGETGGWVPISLTSKIGPLRAAMKGTESGGGRCIGLEGGIGEANIGCGIYPLRPSVCRDYEAYDHDGTPNPDCQRLRLAKGLPPLPERFVDALAA